MVSGVVAYLFMLTDVLSYLLRALAWQGVFVTAWVAIALASLYFTNQRSADLTDAPAFPGRQGLPALGWPVVAWIVSSGASIALTEQTALPVLASLAPIVPIALAVLLYVPAVKRTQRAGSLDLHDSV